MRSRMGPSLLHDFGEVFAPEEASEPILAREVRSALLAWLEEIWAEDDLAEVGLEPRRRALFDGPPGVGKTTLAHHLAARLGLAMVAVRPDRVVDAWLGSTSRNIGTLFDAVAAHGEPVILFFDEFDVLGQKRRNGTSTGAEDERNSFVNTLLQRIDQHKGFMIAATNRGSDIDTAIWRRFDIHISLKEPGPFERERILARYLAPFGLPAGALSALAESFETATPALMRQFAEHLKRQIVLGPKIGWEMGKGAVISRILASVSPHPDLGKPRLWSHGGRDKAIAAMPWPLPMADEIADGERAVAAGGLPAGTKAAGGGEVVPFAGGGR